MGIPSRSARFLSRNWPVKSASSRLNISLTASALLMIRSSRTYLLGGSGFDREAAAPDAHFAAQRKRSNVCGEMVSWSLTEAGELVQPGLIDAGVPESGLKYTSSLTPSPQSSLA